VSGYDPMGSRESLELADPVVRQADGVPGDFPDANPYGILAIARKTYAADAGPTPWT
jgi:hypothetical protein